jgi:hypothetical protein
MSNPMIRRFAPFLLLCACTDDGPSGGGTTGETHVESYHLPAQQAPKLDLLFVIDDTTAMASHQTALQALPAMVEAGLASSTGVVAHYHLGVVTTDSATSGNLRTSSSVQGTFINHDEGTFGGSPNNYTGSLGAALTSLFPSSATSNAQNRPLATMRAALDANAANAGFRRSDAYLGMVTITASDDASSGTPEEYASFLKTAQSDPTNVIVSGVIPSGASRISTFHAQFPNRNDVSSIDSTDYSGALDMFAQLYKTTLGYACNKEPADVDATTPGPQYDCSFIYLDGSAEHLLPQCGNTSQPCWELVVADPQICTDPATRAHLQTRGFTSSTSASGDPYHPEVRGQCVVN